MVGRVEFSQLPLHHLYVYSKHTRSHNQKQCLIPATASSGHDFNQERLRAFSFTLFDRQDGTLSISLKTSFSIFRNIHRSLRQVFKCSANEVKKQELSAILDQTCWTFTWENMLLFHQIRNLSSIRVCEKDQKLKIYDS